MWYKRLKLAQMRRWAAEEYWIAEDGSTMYADGDVGDMNHEAYVIATVLSQYDLNPEEVDVESNEFLDDFAANNLEECVELLRQQGNWGAKEDQLLESDPHQAEVVAGRNMTLEDILLIKGATPEEAAIGSGRGDVRLFAKKNWGWKRVQGNNVETWTLTPNDMLAIWRGMGEIFEMGGMDDEADPEVNVNVESNGSWFTDVPLSVFGSREAASLIQQYNGMRGNQLVKNVGFQSR